MKNLKMFAIGLAAMAAMTMGVHAEGVVKMTKGNVEHTYNTIQAALDDIGDATEATIVVTDDVTESQDIEITKNITLDLGGNTVDIATYSIKINGGTLTLTGTEKSTITNKSNSTVSMIKITGENSHLVVGKDVTVNNASTSNASYAVAVFGDTESDYSAKKSTIEINGKLVATDNGGALSTYGRLKKDKNPVTITVNDNAVLESKKGGAVYLAGYANVTVGKATITGSSVGVAVRSGNVVFNGTTVTANGDLAEGSDMVGGMNVTGTAIQIESSKVGAYEEPATVTLNGGTYTSKNNSAVVINNYDGTTPAIAPESKITGGASLVSGTNEDDEVLPGISILVENDEAVDETLKAFESFVDNAKFNGTMAQMLTSDEGVINTNTLNATLTKGSSFTEEDGKVVVGTQTTEPEPTNPDTPSAGDGKDPQNPSEPPKTGDNIMAFVGLGIASLAVVGLGTKNLKKQTN